MALNPGVVFLLGTSAPPWRRGELDARASRRRDLSLADEPIDLSAAAVEGQDFSLHALPEVPGAQDFSASALPEPGQSEDLRWASWLDEVEGQGTNLSHGNAARELAGHAGVDLSAAEDDEPNLNDSTDDAYRDCVDQFKDHGIYLPLDAPRGRRWRTLLVKLTALAHAEGDDQEDDDLDGDGDDPFDADRDNGDALVVAH